MWSHEAYKKAFAYEHLPERLQKISKPYGELAAKIWDAPDSIHRDMALQKLLEAKDAAVRAML